MGSPVLFEPFIYRLVNPIEPSLGSESNLSFGTTDPPINSVLVCVCVYFLNNQTDVVSAKTLERVDERSADWNAVMGNKSGQNNIPDGKGTKVCFGKLVIRNYPGSMVIYLFVRKPGRFHLYFIMIANRRSVPGTVGVPVGNNVPDDVMFVTRCTCGTKFGYRGFSTNLVKRDTRGRCTGSNRSSVGTVPKGYD